MYRVDTDDWVQQQVDALPADALPLFAELRTLLEVDPWCGDLVNDQNPGGRVRTLTFGRAHEGLAAYLILDDRCCDDLLDVEYRAACRRLLARAAAGNPDIFRRRGRADTAAAAVCWIIGKANDLFSNGGLLVKDLMSHFRIQGSVSTRSEPLLRAVGVDPHQYGAMNLGSPDYLTSSHREQIVARRDHYRAMDDTP